MEASAARNPPLQASAPAKQPLGLAQRHARAREHARAPPTNVDSPPAEAACAPAPAPAAVLRIERQPTPLLMPRTLADGSFAMSPTQVRRASPARLRRAPPAPPRARRRAMHATAGRIRRPAAPARTSPPAPTDGLAPF